MALDGQNAAMQTENYIVMPDLLATTQQALESLDTLLKEAKGTVKSLVAKDGRISSSLMEQHQAAAHGLSWLATYHESMRIRTSALCRPRISGHQGARRRRDSPYSP